MRRFRFHIGTIVILILLLAIGFAALRESDEIWDSSMFSLTLGVLLISILLAVHRTETRRAFWLGFALVGWIYVGLSLVPSIESRLITTKAITFVDSKVPRSVARSEALYDLLVVNNSQPITPSDNKGNGDHIDIPLVAGSEPWFPNIVAGPSLTASNGTTENFVRIGHSLLTLVAALLGGQLSRYLHARNRQGTSESLPTPASTSDDSAA
jgi:hypothetical protein